MATYWCGEHFRPFENDLNIDALRATEMLVAKVLTNEKFLTTFNLEIEHLKSIPILTVREKLIQVTPICCFVGDDIVRSVFEACKSEYKQE